MRLHQDLLKLHGVDPAFLVHGSVGDDVISDGSGESTTCDSGRGGSEEDNGSHGRASPVHKDSSGMNNLSQPNRPLRPSKPPRTAATIAPSTSNIPRTFGPNLPPSGGLPALSGRQLAHSLDTPCLEPLKQYNNSQRQGQYQPPARSLSAPPVKHVSFSDEHNTSTSSVNRQHGWPELLPPHPRGQGAFSSSMSPVAEGRVTAPEGKYGSSSTRGHPFSQSRRHPSSPIHELNLNIDRSFDTMDDGNSTTTSGSYTVDDLSPRAVNIAYMPEQAVV
ncbi:hypothetical protein PoB_000446500 [Plakobranchus ocellatus]|uniref:Uncharacterized protein n=1 Tax=Plakobranchus ocellatus TaxID=259542 RepID=A0AAV3Y4E8_9GAST|nr:hypothetical protein PoB_000446500 [Plakobranchus ocellatus]